MQIKREVVLQCVLGVGLLVAVPAYAEDPTMSQLHHGAKPDRGDSAEKEACASSVRPGEALPALESLQVETSDIRLFERFFERYLQIHPHLRLDHPQVDHVRAYCYRNVSIVVRQDVTTPRPTGWVQVNFVVQDLQTVQREFEEAEHRLASAETLAGPPGATYRLRVKSDVPRNHCRVDRLELSGPEGFMIGFNQIKEGSCRPASHDHGAAQ